MKDYAKLIEGSEFTLREAEENHEEAQTNHKALIGSMREKEAARDQLQQELQSAQLEADKARKAVHDSVAELNKVKHDVSQIKLDLEEMKREKQVLDLIAKQQDYWDVLQKRIEQRRSDLDFGLEGIGGQDRSIEEIIERMKNVTYRGGFSHQANDARSGESIYNSYIRKICEITIDGGDVGFDLKQERINIIDRFLNQSTIRPLWN